MLVETLAGVVLVLVTMVLAIRLVRIAANLVIVVVCGGGCGFAIFNIVNQYWQGWPQIAVYSAATGLAAAMLSMPALPFSRFRKD